MAYNIISYYNIFKKAKRYYETKKIGVVAELSTLPSTGSVIIKNIKNHKYYYLVYRDGTKIIFLYMGKEKPLQLIEQNKRRRELKKQLKIINDGLTAIGISSRNSIGLSKRYKILLRDDFTCQYCGRDVKTHGVVLEVDHIIPKKKGGSDNSSNLITACFDCNRGKRCITP